MLFSESGSSLVHHYRVFGRSAAHTSLCGKFMAKLIMAEAEAKWEAGRLPIQMTQLPAVSATLDPGVRTMKLWFARPVGRCPRLYRKCQLVPCRQLSFRQSRHIPGRLRPMICRRRARTSMVGSHLYCRCRYHFCDSLRRILCRLLSGLR